MIPFFLRERLKFKGRRYSEKGSESALLTERERLLLVKYELSDFFSVMSAESLRENLIFLDLLSRLGVNELFEGSSVLSVLDVGPSTWRILPALSLFLKKQVRGAIQLHGVELDAHRLLSDFSTTESRARYWCKTVMEKLPLVKSEWWAGDASAWLAQRDDVMYDMLVFWFPFLHRRTVKKWGLPESQFQGVDLLRNAVKHLKRGGFFIMANQGDDEWSVVQNAQLPLKCLRSLSVTDSLHESTYKIWLSVWTLEA